MQPLAASAEVIQSVDGPAGEIKARDTGNPDCVWCIPYALRRGRAIVRPNAPRLGVFLTLFDHLRALGVV